MVRDGFFGPVVKLEYIWGGACQDYVPWVGCSLCDQVFRL